VEFGRLLCPNFDKAWSVNEVVQHQGDNDWEGQVYDLSNFVRGDHSDNVGQPGNGVDALKVLAGQDLTYYFPPPLVLGRPNLVTDGTLSLTAKNAMITIPQAMHVSEQLQTQSKALSQANWYTQTFLLMINQYHKGPLVWEHKAIAVQAVDTSIA